MLGPLYAAAGDKKAAALPVFRALSGAVLMGSLSGKGKVSCWKAFNEASDDTPEELASMSTCDHLSDKARKAAEQFAHYMF